MTDLRGLGNFRRPHLAPVTRSRMMASGSTWLRPGRTALVLAIAILGPACTTQRVSSPMGEEMAAVAPQLSVERFLQAVNARDYQSMARLFGTYDGPVSGERTTIELWMDTLARVLQHQDYRIVGESQVPGREHPTTRVGVDLTIGGEVVPNVAFMVVQTRRGGWLVTEIDIEAITNR